MGSFGRPDSRLPGVGVLSLAVGATGALTASYFVVASHVLDAGAAKRVDVLWSITWVVVAVIYRPVEQLVSRTVSRGQTRHGSALREAAAIQAAFALLFVVAALALRGPLEDGVLDGSRALYAIFLGSVVVYAASYLARGWLAGTGRFGLYGGLVLLESGSRLSFALAVAVGVAAGQDAVALGILAAPLLSLAVVPLASRRIRRSACGRGDEGTARASAGFAMAVAAIMLAEQALLNAGILASDATAGDAAVAGIVFNVMLISRAPLQLFQSVQTTLLPHLSALDARGEVASLARAVWAVLRPVAWFTLATVLGALTLGPLAMAHVFGQHYDYGRLGLAAVALAMGLHLVAGTLNQAALARGRAVAAAGAWMLAAGGFVVWLFVAPISDAVARAEIGYALSTATLTGLLLAVHRAPAWRRPSVAARSSRPTGRMPAWSARVAGERGDG